MRPVPLIIVLMLVLVGVACVGMQGVKPPVDPVGVPGGAATEGEKAPAPVLADANSPVEFKIEVLAEGNLKDPTHLRVSVTSRMELAELRVAPLAAGNFERPKLSDSWIFKPVVGRTVSHDFYLQMTKLDRHYVQVAWVALLPNQERWRGREGATIHRQLRAARSLGFAGVGPGGESRVQVRAVKRQGGAQ